MSLSHDIPIRSKIKSLLLFLLLLFFIFISSFSFLYATCEPDPLCGPKSLLVVCQRLGVQTNLEEIKKLSDYDEQKGTTMAGLYKAAQAKGLQAEGMKLSIEGLSKLKIPIIAYSWENHCVVIDKIKGDKLTIIDPPHEPYTISKKEFANNYSGFALLVSKNKFSFPKIETKGPDMRFNEYIYDFGKVEEGENIEHIFKFENVGNKELLIDRVRAPCSCTATVVSDTQILPNEEGHIKVSFNTTNYVGPQEHEIYVFSNDVVTSLVELKIKGMVKRGLIVTPSSIKMGSIKKGSFSTGKIYLIESDEEFKIIKTETSSEYISIKVSQSTEAHRKGFEVEVALKPNIPIGELEEKVIIHTTSEKYPTIEIPVSANIKGDIEFHPDTFFLGVINKGDTPSCKVTLLTTGSEPLKLEKIDPEPEQARFRGANPLDDYISIAITPKVEGKEYEFTATLKDNAPTGTIKGNITVYTNNLDQPQIEIPVYGLVRE